MMKLKNIFLLSLSLALMVGGMILNASATDQNPAQQIRTIHQFAKQGQVVGNPFGVGSTYSDIVKEWGHPDSTDYEFVFYYYQHDASFKVSKGKVFEVSLALPSATGHFTNSTYTEICQLTYDQVISELGTPSGEQVVDTKNVLYRAGDHILEFVFDKTTNKIKDLKVF